MKLYDLFMFNGEEELLEIRLNTLDSIVDYFVIGSCEYSHSGILKGLNEIPYDLMLKFRHKILFYEIPFIPSSDPWYNEQYGRQYIYEQIKDRIKTDDFLFVSDLDEIPNPVILKEKIGNFEGPTTFCGDCFLFCLDLWGRKSIDGVLINPEFHKDLNAVRSHRTNWKYQVFRHIPDSSWHFSSVGTPENIAKKMSYFGHCNEFTGEVRNPDYIKKLIQGKCGFDITKPNTLIEWDINKLPSYIQRNQDKFKHLFYNYYK